MRRGDFIRLVVLPLWQPRSSLPHSHPIRIIRSRSFVPYALGGGNDVN
jgi:hypothetical protein